MWRGRVWGGGAREIGGEWGGVVQEGAKERGGGGAGTRGAGGREREAGKKNEDEHRKEGEGAKDESKK